jgi:predicted metal-dependent phosphoesterase TrpH
MQPMAGRGRSTADLHLHTTYSDGWPDPRALVDYARHATDLRVIAVTDHDTIEGALRARDHSQGRSGLEVVIGEEVSSRDGHIVGLFLERRVRPGMSAAATVHAIHEQGGLAFAAHPFWRTTRQVKGRSIVHGVGWLAGELAFDAIEVENSTPGFYLFNQMAHRLVEATGVPELGNSDAHILDAIGRAFTSFPGRTADQLRVAIENGATRAHRRRYRPMGLVRYAAWGFNHTRAQAVAVAAAR